MALSMQKNDHSLLVIASYPPKDAIHHPSIVGGASYTKNTLLAIQKFVSQSKQNFAVTILAEKLNQTGSTYEDEHMTIKRIWQRNRFTSFFKLAQAIQSDKTNAHILFSLELAMFGGRLSLLGVILLLVWLKLCGKKTFIVAHQVITNIQDMEGHLGKTSPTLMTNINNLILKEFYRLTVWSSYKTIVFEQTFKDYLNTVGKPSKIVVIPHGVEKFTDAASKTQARKKLQIDERKQVILLFGFLAWYKGTDWIVNQIDKESLQKHNIQIIIAGGPNPNRLELDFYQKYLQDLQRTADEKNITITGFVPEDQIGLYFHAADLVLFPYRALMSSSGPLSITLAFGTPLLLADKLSPLTETIDFQSALKNADLTASDLFFPLNEQGIKTILSKSQDKRFLDNSHKFALELAHSRDWSQIGKTYFEVLFSD